MNQSLIHTARLIPGRTVLGHIVILLVMMFIVMGQRGEAQKLSFGEKPLQFEGIQAPTHKSAKMLDDLEVRYPDSAIRTGMQGIATVAAFIDEKGYVIYGEVERSSGHELLDKAALEAVEHGNFKAAWRDNHPVGSRVTIPVEFRLPDADDFSVDKDAGALHDDVQQLKKSKKYIEDEQRKLEMEIQRLRARQDSLKKK
jgi:TonB family protein